MKKKSFNTINCMKLIKLYGMNIHIRNECGLGGGGGYFYSYFINYVI